MDDIFDTLVIKLMSLAVHAEELIEGFKSRADLTFDIAAIESLLTDPEVQERRDALDELALLPVKR